MSPHAPWPDQLADALAGLALQLQPELGASLLATLRRCVAQLEAEREAGHVCLPLTAVDAARLRATGLVMAAAEDGRPLVIDDADRLYLQRDHDHELALAKRIAALRAAPLEPIPREPLRSLFPGAARGAVDWQAVAVAQALRQRLTLISGGPGTGKTSTVVKLLACAVAARPEARIALAAPTGKASQRLLESLREGAARLPPALRETLALPTEALTVHRLLGAGAGGFRHGAHAPLGLDWLVVDEASMLDLALARQLFDALGPQTRLVLLGDRHQLDAVENGAVFAELSRAPAWRPETAQALADALGRAADAPLDLPAAGDLPDLAVQFQVSHRFAADSGIGRLAAQVREGDAPAVLTLLHAGAPELRWMAGASAAQLDALLDAGFAPYAAALQQLCQQPASEAAEAAVWRAWEGFRLLCAGHAGPWGTRALNARAAQRLQAALPLGCPAGLGQALLVTRNQGEWVNGDVLLMLPGARGSHGPLEAALRRGDQRRRFDAERLPAELDGAFAMTVHKAQGSEFDAVLLALPDAAANASHASREWLYTGATRARRQLTVLGSEAALQRAVETSLARRSGLRRRLAG